MTYPEAFSISLLVGLLGGLSSHATWLIAHIRKRLENNEMVSASPAFVKTRLFLFGFTVSLGAIGGAIAGTMSYSRDLGVGTLVGLSFAGGFAIDTIISRVSKTGVG